MVGFLEPGVVASALEQSDITPLETANILYAVSPSRNCAIYVLEHNAWHIENQGWRSMRAPPPDGEEGRKKLWIVNLPGKNKIRWSGFDVFIPKAESILSLSASADSLSIVTVNGHRNLGYDRLPGLFWKLITGHAESEKMIEQNFAKLFD